MLPRLTRRCLPSTTWSTEINNVSLTPTIPSLPLEILFKIIDEHFVYILHADIRSIRRFSLVCRALARYCRPTLFRVLSVGCPSSERGHHYWHAGSGCRRPTSCLTAGEFSDFLSRDSWSTLGSLVAAIEELYLFLPDIPTSKLSRRFGLNNLHEKTRPWLWILYKQRKHLRGFKLTRIFLGANALPGLLPAALMGLVNDAPGLKVFDVRSPGLGYINGGELLLSTPSSKAVCASIQFLELDMVIWEYIYRRVALQRTIAYPGPPLFPNLRGIGIRGWARFSRHNIAAPTDERSKIIGGHSSPLITHLHFHRLGQTLESEHLLLLRLCGRSLRCLHLDLVILSEHQTLPFHSLPSLEYLAVGLKHVVKDHLSSNVLEWISRSFDTLDSSLKPLLLKKLLTHIVINDQRRNNPNQTLAEKVLEVENEYLTRWSHVCQENQWPALVEAKIYAFVSVWVPGPVPNVYDARPPRMLGRYHPHALVNFVNEAMSYSLETMCSCSDLLQRNTISRA
jgi:hypothetical protein